MKVLRWTPTLCFVLLLPLAAFGDNLTFGGAARLMIGDAGAKATYTGTQQRWYDIQVVAGRSYCAEVTTDAFERDRIDPRVDVYQQNGTTLIVGNDDANTEPKSRRGSRACWIASATRTNLVRVKHFSTSSTPTFNTFHLRVVETTMWCPFWFIGADYQAFSLLRNTTNQTINVEITWRNSAGAVVGTVSASVGANNNLVRNARLDVNLPAVDTTGSIDVAHDGSPDALKGSTVTLSASTGLSFDALFEMRRPW